MQVALSELLALDQLASRSNNILQLQNTNQLGYDISALKTN
jgi:hypothetical protein